MLTPLQGPRNFSHLSSRRSGFTIVEILVVCAVVGILSAILLSAFSRARDGARRATCASNLKQIGLATEMYATDHAGRYPQTGYHRRPQCGWAERLLPYIRTTSTFECPSAIKCPFVPGCVPEAGTDNLNEFRIPVTYKGSYDMNSLHRSRFPISASFRHPASTISVLDGDGSFIQPGFEDLSSEDAMAVSGIRPGRHQGGSNVLFADGHVKWMRYESLADRKLWSLGTPPPLP